MYMKRIAKAAVAVTLALSLFAMPVSAHGQHHGQATQQTTQTTQTTQQPTVDATNTSCPVCTVEGCTEKCRHSHEKDYYPKVMRKQAALHLLKQEKIAPPFLAGLIGFLVGEKNYIKINLWL